MPLVGVVQVGVDERRADVLGLGVGQQWTDLRPGAVGTDFLTQTAERWEKLDPADYPFLTRTTTDLRDHDDRDQFTTGLDLLLDGLNATTEPRPPA